VRRANPRLMQKVAGKRAAAARCAQDQKKRPRRGADIPIELPIGEIIFGQDQAITGHGQFREAYGNHLATSGRFLQLKIG